jgi:hypothetical protein
VIIILTIVLIVIIWFSHPVIFIIIGTILAKTMTSYKQLMTNKRRLTFMITITGAVALSFLLNYIYTKKIVGIHGVHHLQNYWENGFMPLFPTKSSDLVWIIFRLFSILKLKGFFYFWQIAGISLVFGIIYLYKTNLKNFTYFLSPIVLTLFASALHQYPFRGRLTLFLFPIFIIIISVGFNRLLAMTKITSFRMIIASLILFPPLVTSIHFIIKPRQRNEAKYVLSYIATHKQPEDPILIMKGSKPSFAYYARDYSLQDSEVILGLDASISLEESLSQLDQIRNDLSRIWIFYSYDRQKKGVSQKALIKNYLSEVGTLEEEYIQTGAGVYLYSFEKNKDNI